MNNTSHRPVPVFRALDVRERDFFLAPLVLDLPRGRVLGRRLRQRDDDNPSGGMHPDAADTLLKCFVGTVFALDNTDPDHFGVALSAPAYGEPVWFQLRSSDARDLRNRFKPGMSAGFSVRFSVLHDGTTPGLTASQGRGFYIPHAVAYVPDAERNIVKESDEE